MLYNPNWQPLDLTSQRSLLTSLVAWLEKQSPETEYRWADINNCVIGQWAAAVGVWGPGAHAYMVKGNHFDLREPHTFGAALERARNALERGCNISS